MKIFMDTQGRMTDENGNVITMSQPHALQINDNKIKDSKVKDLERIMKFGRQANPALAGGLKKKFFDASLQTASNSRGSGGRRDKRRSAALSFVEPGTYVKRGELMRRKQVQEDLELDPLTSFSKQLDRGVAASGLDDCSATPKLNKFGEQFLQIPAKQILGQLQSQQPSVEWWDEFFLAPNCKSFPEPLTPDSLFTDRVTKYVQHPVPLQNEQVEAAKSMIIPFYLTEQEKRKLKRKKRLEKEKEKQEKISLGLMKAPPPRVTLKNYMNVMAQEAIVDPSKCEQKVQKIVHERLEEHFSRNEARRLSTSE